MWRKQRELGRELGWELGRELGRELGWEIGWEVGWDREVQSFGEITISFISGSAEPSDS